MQLYMLSLWQEFEGRLSHFYDARYLFVDQGAWARMTAM